jgi:hypothetical protein
LSSNGIQWPRYLLSAALADFIFQPYRCKAPRAYRLISETGAPAALLYADLPQGLAQYPLFGLLVLTIIIYLYRIGSQRLSRSLCFLRITKKAFSVSLDKADIARYHVERINSF